MLKFLFNYFLVSVFFLQSIPGYAAPTTADLIAQETTSALLKQMIQKAKETHSQMNSWDDMEKLAQKLPDAELKKEYLSAIHQNKSKPFPKSTFEQTEKAITILEGDHKAIIDFDKNTLTIDEKMMDLKGKSIKDIHEFYAAVDAKTTMNFSSLIISDAHAVLPVLAIIYFVFKIIMIVQGLISFFSNMSCSSAAETFNKVIQERLSNCMDHYGDKSMPFSSEDKSIANILDTVSDEKGFNEVLCRSGMGNKFRTEAHLLVFSFDYSCLLGKRKTLCSKLKELDRCYSRDKIFVNNYDRSKVKEAPASGPAKAGAGNGSSRK